MKKLFINIGAWFKKIFNWKTKEVVNTKIEVEVKVKEKSREELLFDELKRRDFFKGSITRKQLNEDLAKSAKKLNDYRDSQNTIKGFNKPSPALKGKLNGEMAKDITTIKRQEIRTNKRDENKSTTHSDYNLDVDIDMFGLLNNDND